MILENWFKNIIFSGYDFKRIFISENFSKIPKSEISDFKIIESFEIQKSWNWYKSPISENQLIYTRNISLSVKRKYPKSLQNFLIFACIRTIPGKYTLCNYIKSEKSVLQIWTKLTLFPHPNSSYIPKVPIRIHNHILWSILSGSFWYSQKSRNQGFESNMRASEKYRFFDIENNSLLQK